jgi:hypothetical protein
MASNLLDGQSVRNVKKLRLRLVPPLDLVEQPVVLVVTRRLDGMTTVLDALEAADAGRHPSLWTGHLRDSVDTDKINKQYDPASKVFYNYVKRNPAMLRRPLREEEGFLPARMLRAHWTAEQAGGTRHHLMYNILYADAQDEEKCTLRPHVFACPWKREYLPLRAIRVGFTQEEVLEGTPAWKAAHAAAGYVVVGQHAIRWFQSAEHSPFKVRDTLLKAVREDDYIVFARKPEERWAALSDVGHPDNDVHVLRM